MLASHPALNLEANLCFSVAGKSAALSFFGRFPKIDASKTHRVKSFQWGAILAWARERAWPTYSVGRMRRY